MHVLTSCLVLIYFILLAELIKLLLFKVGQAKSDDVSCTNSIYLRLSTG